MGREFIFETKRPRTLQRSPDSDLQRSGSQWLGYVRLCGVARIGKGWHRAIIEGISGVQKQGQGSEL